MRHFTILACAAATLLASAANAKDLRFTYSEVAGINFTFIQSSAPTPLSFVDGLQTQVSVKNWSGHIIESDIFYYIGSEGGGFSTDDAAYNVFGPQLYTGPETAPIFAYGTFSGQNAVSGLDGTLSITAVPEPATWALMLGGMGLCGAVLRKQSRRRAESAAA